MGKKYIIEIPDDKIGDFIGSTHFLMPYMMAGHIGHHDTGLPIKPYTEPDMEQVRKEAYEQGLNDANYAIADDSYQKGLSDAWEAARKIALDKEDGGLDTVAYCETFGYGKGFGTVLKTYTASEAIEKIRQYEQEQEEQIQIGDEVEDGVANLIVLEINQDGTVSGFDDAGSIIHATPRKKTGRHFPEIAEVLQKMKES